MLPPVCLRSIWTIFVQKQPRASLTFIFYIQHRPIAYWKTSCMKHQTAVYLFIFTGGFGALFTQSVVSLHKFISLWYSCHSSSSSTVWQPWTHSQRWHTSPHTHKAAPASASPASASASASEAEKLDPEDPEVLSSDSVAHLHQPR